MFTIEVNFSIRIGRKQGNTTALTNESWGRIRKIIGRRDGFVCRYCGQLAPNGHVDHVIPLSKGGTDAPDNLAWACPTCNISKGDKILPELANGHEGMKISVVTPEEKDVQVSYVIPLPEGGTEGLARYARAILNGTATFSESGGKSVEGATSHGFTKNQYRDELKPSAIALGFVIDRGNAGVKWTDAGFSWLVQTVAAEYGPDAVPEEYQDYMPCDEG